jgi:hypothetical protein
MAHEPGPHRLLAVDQRSSRPGVSSLRRALSGRPPTAGVLLLAPVFDNGFRPTHLPREFARHRSLFAFVARIKSNVLLQRRYSHAVTSASACAWTRRGSVQVRIRVHLSRPVAEGESLRRVNQQAAEVPDQQLHASGADHRANLQAALAGVAVLQMDQAALAHQGLLRHQRERGEDANLDRGAGVRTGGHRAQTTGIAGQSVPNPTDSQPHTFRKTPISCALQAIDMDADLAENPNQLILFDF